MTEVTAPDPYALALDEAEVARYRMMAAHARGAEADLWRRAGVLPGARVADVGCGPGAVLAVLAEEVGSTGQAIGVDADPGAVAAAQALTAGTPGVSVRVGEAADTGLPPASFDVVMVRHVLAHNGPTEGAIVRHLATLLRPGGCLYLADVDGTSMRVEPDFEPDLQDMQQRYVAFHAARGNDLRTGLRLGALLRAAGLGVEDYQGRYTIMPAPVGMRPPSWAARAAMVAAGLATEADLAGWGAALERADAAPTRPTVFMPLFLALGRRPG